jgi:hypothetical protein
MHLLFQFLNTLSRYILNKVGDKLHLCLNPLVTLNPFVIRFPIFILELDPSYSAFIAFINLVVIANPSRVSYNFFNGILSYAFVKSINNKCNSLLVAFFFSIICVMQKILYIYIYIYTRVQFSMVIYVCGGKLRQNHFI